MKLRWLRTRKKIAANPKRIGDTQTVWSYDLTLQYFDGGDWADVPTEDANKPEEHVPHLELGDTVINFDDLICDRGHGKI